MKMRQKIQKDLQEALKQSEEGRLSVLRLLWDGLIKKEKEKRVSLSDKTEEQNLEKESQLDDKEILQLISTSVKRSKEAVLQFKEGRREDLVQKEEQEIEILKKYLPEQLGEDKIKKLAQETIKEQGAENFQDMGKVMKVLMPKLQGQADGGLVQKIVKDLLPLKKSDDRSQ